jgi:DNA sulfur modification protein DndB
LEAFSYQFTALRGIQAGREYYVVMCPLKLIPRIFLFDEEEIPTELRAQRMLNRARVPEIARYLIDNTQGYVFSSLTASIDGDVSFQPMSESGPGRNVGTLIVPMQSRFLINDGQHRRAAVEEALRIRPELGDETLSVVFFVDAGLERSQQLFADLNKYAVRPSRSIGILYDKRDARGQMTIGVIRDVPAFDGFIEMEKTNLGVRSPKLFTLSSVYEATVALLGVRRGQQIPTQSLALAKTYWQTLSAQIPEWGHLAAKKLTAPSLRSDYVHAHGVVLHALGIVGRDLLEQYPDTWGKQLESIRSINWSRTNTAVWEGRALEHGKISKATKNVTLTANYIKRALDLELTADEAKQEREFLGQKAN